jgi:hypothetical protein
MLLRLDLDQPQDGKSSGRGTYASLGPKLQRGPRPPHAEAIRLGGFPLWTTPSSQIWTALALIQLNGRGSNAKLAAMLPSGRARGGRAVVRRDALADFENGSQTPIASNLAAIRAALEGAGVIFIGEKRRGARRQAAEEARAMRACQTDSPNLTNL